ncbi:hypothetical protein [Bacillus sp. Marseille-Q1617]|uniref:SGNH/GDSL hydrolase family protein n=1 Tax=Bacillus sp. Marseille-Q1617 TaxID=2736887 RepID=UPI00158F641C|nr:hypothetical protein [Bacillus sp. Marseille-Q1617]
MKNVLLICLLIITVYTLTAGKLHWDKRVIAVQAGSAATNDVNHQDKKEKEVISAAEVIDKDKLVKLDKVNHLPPELQQKFREKINGDDQPVYMMVLGSSSTSQKEGGWPKQLENKLHEFYGKSLVEVSIKEIANKTSDQVISENIHKDLAGLTPDILLLEPFLLYDNGELSISDRLQNLSTIIEVFKEHNPEMTVMIQPANPIHGARHYPNEEQDLEDYAKQNKYIYLNHWYAWPDHKGKEIKEYLTNENLPNDKGNGLWAKYLIDYFVRK